MNKNNFTEYRPTLVYYLTNLVHKYFHSQIIIYSEQNYEKNIKIIPLQKKYWVIKIVMMYLLCKNYIYYVISLNISGRCKHNFWFST